jgi:hypothetical protein
MSDEQGSGNVDWEHVGRLELHPRRFGLIEIVSIDGGRTLSPTECAHELQTDTADATCHMNVLKRRRLG